MSEKVIIDCEVLFAELKKQGRSSDGARCWTTSVSSGKTGMWIGIKDR